MTICVRCDEDGGMSVLNCFHKDVAKHLGGEIGFVGAVLELNILILAALATTLPMNKTLNSHGAHFHQVAHGPLVFVASDENGDEIDVDVPSLDSYWRREGGEQRETRTEGESRWY